MTISTSSTCAQSEAILPRGVKWGDPLTPELFEQLRAVRASDITSASLERLEGYKEGIDEARQFLHNALEGQAYKSALTTSRNYLQRLGEGIQEQVELLRSARVSPRPKTFTATFPTQDPKYSIRGGRLVNSVTGAMIPFDEPIFIFRGKDKNAIKGIMYYREECANHAHRSAVSARVTDFYEFSQAQPARMVEPTT